MSAPTLSCPVRLFGSNGPAELGRFFAVCLGRATSEQLQEEGYDVADLVQRGWIARVPGRWSAPGFQPAGPVEIEMGRARRNIASLKT